MAKLNRSSWIALCLLALLFVAPAVPWKADGPEGRWLFHIFLENGTDKVAAFIAEIRRQDGVLRGEVISSNADLKFTVPRIDLQGSILSLDVQSQQGTLNFVGELKGNNLIQGSVTGTAFKDRPFVAERTQLTDLGRPKPPSREERLAYQRAISIRDLGGRIAALQQFIQQYSRSQLKDDAYQQVFLAHLNNKSSDEEVLRAADAWGVNAPDRFRTLNEVAMLLAGEGRLLDFAEKISNGLLQRFGDKSPPAYLHGRALISSKKGDQRQAVEYLERALKLDPDNGETLRLLAEAWEGLGEEAKAEQSHLKAFMESGNRLSLSRLRRFYQRRHGSLEGLHEIIDAQYARRPSLFEAGHYQGPEPQRVVLLELFTGSECGPCQASDYAFDGLLEHFPHTALAALQYHVHIPGPDPMASPESLHRARYYGVHSTPDAYFGGDGRRVGGSRRDRAPMFFRDYKAMLEKRLAQPSALELDLKGRLEGGTLHFQATVRGPGDLPVEGHKLHLVLAEAEVHYTGFNGVHFHRNVVRKMMPDAGGSPLAAQPATEAEPNGEKPALLAEVRGSLALSEVEKGLTAYLDAFQQQSGRRFQERVEKIDPRQLRLIAFVQNDKTRQVLQAAIVDVQSPGNPTSPEPQ